MIEHNYQQCADNFWWVLFWSDYTRRANKLMCLFAYAICPHCRVLLPDWWARDYASRVYNVVFGVVRSLEECVDKVSRTHTHLSRSVCAHLSMRIVNNNTMSRRHIFTFLLIARDTRVCSQTNAHCIMFSACIQSGVLNNSLIESDSTTHFKPNRAPPCSIDVQPYSSWTTTPSNCPTIWANCRRTIPAA